MLVRASPLAARRLLGKSGQTPRPRYPTLGTRPGTWARAEEGETSGSEGAAFLATVLEQLWEAGLGVPAGFPGVPIPISCFSPPSPVNRVQGTPDTEELTGRDAF